MCTSPSCGVFETPDGCMICGTHAQTSQENREEKTVSSIYIIEHGGMACIVDTGRYAPIYAALNTVLRQRKLKIQYIILSHDHYDHIGNATQLQREYGGKIIAHALDVPLMSDPLLPYDHARMRAAYGTSMQSAYSDLGCDESTLLKLKNITATYFAESVHVDMPLDADTVLDLAGLELHILHTPGHSPGSISVYIPSSASVYTGDLTFWVNPCRPYPIGNARQCLQSLQSICTLQPHYCGCGHYQGIVNPSTWLHTLLQKHIRLEQDILQNLQQPCSLIQLRKRIFPTDPFDSFSPIPENSLQAWLASLVQEEKIIRQQSEHGVLWFHN